MKHLATLRYLLTRYPLISDHLLPMILGLIAAALLIQCERVHP